MRRFYLQRDRDHGGISGTGRVMDGVVFRDGVVAVRWNTKTATTTILDSIDDLKAINVHSGNSIVWIDDAED